jgi:hypothetical protein
MFEFKVSDFLVFRPMVQRLLTYDPPRRPMGDEPFEKIPQKTICLALFVGGAAIMLGTLYRR